ncbi:MAG: erythromycin esterase family protein [Candidatus Sericytochromatia bacterium]
MNHSEFNYLKENIIKISTIKPETSLDDLELLDKLIGDSNLVLLGETTHGTKEVFQMKHRLIEYLVIKKKFNIFSIEASMTDAYNLNEFILYGKGNPEILLKSLNFWCWNTEELLKLILWMRNFNISIDSKYQNEFKTSCGVSTPKEEGLGGATPVPPETPEHSSEVFSNKNKKIKFTGFDMQSIKRAINNISLFAKKYDNNLEIFLDDLNLINEEITSIYKKLYELYFEKIKSIQTDKEKENLFKEFYKLPEELSKKNLNKSYEIYNYIIKNKENYLKQININEYNWLEQNSRIINQYSDCMSRNSDEGGKIRDFYMSENIKWIIDNYEKSKVIVWAHNDHIQKKEGYMGYFLAKYYEKSMKVFGFSLGNGTYTAMCDDKTIRDNNKLIPPIKESFEYYFEKINIPFFILNTKNFNTKNHFLTQTQKFRSIGAVALEDQFLDFNITEQFDFIIYLNKTTGSVLLKNYLSQ